MPGKKREAKNFVWVLADQLISSLGNIAFLVLAVRHMDVEEFGLLSILITVLSLVVGVVRNSFPLALTVEGADGVEDSAGHRALSCCYAVVFAMGAVIGLSFGAVVIAVGGVTGVVAGALVSISIPFLLLQDALRTTAIAAGRPAAAFLNDTVWTSLQIGAATILMSVVRPIENEAGWWLVAWSLTTVPCVVFLRSTSPGAIRAKDLVDYLRTRSRTAGHLAGEFMLTAGIVVAAPALVGFAGGTRAAAGYRLALVVLGPANTLLVGLRTAALPAAVRLGRTSRRATLVLVGCALVGACATGVIWTCWVLVPELFRLIVGPNLTAADGVVAPMALSLLLAALQFPAQVQLRAARRLRESLILRIASSPVLVLGLLWGASRDGAEGAAWGFLAAYAATTVGWWILWSRVWKEPRADGESGDVVTPSADGLYPTGEPVAPR